MDILTVLHIIEDGVNMLSEPVKLYRGSRWETDGSFLWYNIFQLISNGILPGNLFQVPGQFVNGEHSFVLFGTSSSAC